MRREAPPILRFRRRLLRLIDEQYEGKYTRLARRAGLPTSSMQQIIHHANHLPGGEALLRLAAALGVSVHYLATGEEAERPVNRLAHPAPVAIPRAVPPPRGDAPPVALPVYRCGCPDACPLTEPVPPVAAGQARVIVPADLVASSRHHRLLAVRVGPGLNAPDWPDGARLVVDWDARRPRWAAVALFHAEGRCHVGHVGRTADRLFWFPRVDGALRILAPGATILGTVVAALLPLEGPGGTERGA
jgi:transcriptional regulator with XRE-family HTH domain